MDSFDSDSSFMTIPGFCSDCGSILPMINEKSDVTCYTCKRSWNPGVFGDMAMSYIVTFNSNDTYTSEKLTHDDKEADGPVVDRQCAQCNNDKMSYATLQLRSADEGQTIFFMCTKCKFKETENS